MWSLKWYYLGICSSGEALTSGMMLLTFNKRHSSDRKLWERVMEETWLSSSPRADRVLNTGISTQLQRLMEAAYEVGECFPFVGWTGSEGSSHPTIPLSGPSRVLLPLFLGWLLIAPACRTLPVASTRQLLTFSLWCHWDHKVEKESYLSREEGCPNVGDISGCSWATFSEVVQSNQLIWCFQLPQNIQLVMKASLLQEMNALQMIR